MLMLLFLYVSTFVFDCVRGAGVSRYYCCFLFVLVLIVFACGCVCLLLCVRVIVFGCCLYLIVLFGL